MKYPWWYLGPRKALPARVHNPVWRMFSLHGKPALEEATTWQLISLAATIYRILDHRLEERDDDTQPGNLGQQAD